MVERSTRRAFLRGRFQDTNEIRPPGAAPWQSFLDTCTRCSDCANACPEQIITLDTDGLPVVDPRLGACTFCGACTEACPTKALTAGQPWLWHAAIASTCLSMNGVQCRACEDYCDDRAIRFRLALAGKASPEIDLEACTGCGACVAPCPVNAVTLARAPQPIKETATC
ncbi:ferredoxin-type protein NapF [Roseovarius sp. 2305UL8-3]|uniref:ferredoxin-type protein NapF n=1 Tax=Roseovarius conchicola TaxID=3121636 RepID=UPI003528B22B